MKNFLFLSLLAMSFSLNSCQSEGDADFQADDLSLSWELVRNADDEEGNFLARFELTNNGGIPLDANWAIYYNHTNRRIVEGSVSPGFSIEQLSGDFYRFQPSTDYTPLEAGDVVPVVYRGSAWMTKNAESPIRVYIVFKDKNGQEGEPQLLKNYQAKPFVREEQIRKSATDTEQIPTPAFIYAQNEARLVSLEQEGPSIIPTPNQMKVGANSLQLDASWQLQYPEELQNEGGYLNVQLQSLLGKKLSQEVGEGPSIRLALEKGDPEAYRLSVSENEGVIITGSDPAGVFYGIQSLLASLSPEVFREQQTSLSLQEMEVTDAPRFSYRGMHLDVSRNFQSKEAVLKLLDLMAAYKLNKFHFHLTDDEGWRLEIPELPELTEIGAFRGHTLDESDMLHPAYGSGPFADPQTNTGSGYYSQEDFLEILRYATERHIEVISEIDMPGHARAAIVAMKVRAERLRKAGKSTEADTYLLHDPVDESEYRSVQDFDDNVICVCKESTYRFLETVVDRLVKYYEMAEAPLSMVHIGGDEVPAGVWTKSPECEKLIAENVNLQSPADLPFYFLDRFDRILDKHDLKTGGWEEIALKRAAPGGKHTFVVNPDFRNRDFYLYIWNNLGDQIDLGNRLANAGFPVILCGVTNLYFDMAYDKDPNEPGFYWGGYVDTRRAYEFVPEDIFKSTPGSDELAEQWYAEKEKLEKPENVLGIQGQLWSETLSDPDRIEYYYAPKILGLAERVWAEQPSWAKVSNPTARKEALNQAWSRFARQLGQQEFPRLDYLSGGFKYRLAPPGAKIEDGQLFANVAFPGLEIRYTTDGSEPTANSALYEGPVAVQGEVLLRSFATNGRGSRTVRVNTRIKE